MVDSLHTSSQVSRLMVPCPGCFAKEPANKWVLLRVPKKQKNVCFTVSVFNTQKDLSQDIATPPKCHRRFLWLRKPCRSPRPRPAAFFLGGGWALSASICEPAAMDLQLLREKCQEPCRKRRSNIMDVCTDRETDETDQRQPTNSQAARWFVPETRKSPP